MALAKIGAIVAAIGVVTASTAGVVANFETITSAAIFDIATRGYVDGKVDGASTKLAGDIGDAHKLLKTLGNMTADVNVAATELQLESARRELQQAEADLASNPAVQSLRDLVGSLRSEVATLEEALMTAKCYRTEIISEQDQDCRSLD